MILPDPMMVWHAQTKILAEMCTASNEQARVSSLG